jgi:hypothetical protein
MKSARICLASLILLVLAGCGGGADMSVPASGVVSGTVTKGPIGNASVSAFGIGNGQMSGLIGSATTDVNGNFTMTVGGYAGAVMLQVGGGSYIDEATGTSMVMAPGNVMTAVLPSVAAGTTHSGIQVTPVTAMAQAMATQMAGGMTAANIAAANTAMGNYFLVSDILHTKPMNPLAVGAGAGANPAAANYGMTLAAMSQYAMSLNMANSSAMVSAMMGDAFDGVMDGRHGVSQISMAMGGMMGNGMMTPTAGTSSLAAAMTAFMNSAANVSGFPAAEMATLVTKLTNSTGRIQ